MHRVYSFFCRIAALLLLVGALAAIVARGENPPPQFGDGGAIFNPPQESDAPYIPPLAPPDFSATPRLAMVIPTMAGGIVGRAARRFREGFIHAAEIDGVAARLDTYGTDGAPAQAIAAWRAAAAGGAALIIGPMLKDEVAALAEISVSVPTIALQPAHPQNPDAPLFILTLDAGEEAELLAREVRKAGYARAIIVVANTDYGRRVERHFAAEWDKRGAVAERRRIFGETGFVELFNHLKEQRETDEITAIIIAGRGDFARRARAHLPARFAVYALTRLRDGESGAERDLFLDGVRFMEMPWLAAPAATARYDNPAIRDLPLAEQRYFALGIDAFLVARDIAEWLPTRGGWRRDGVSGALVLEDGRRFRRYGIAVVYRGGKLAPHPR